MLGKATIRKAFLLAVTGLPMIALAMPAAAQVAETKIEGGYICVFKQGAVSRGNAQAEAKRSV